MAKLLPVTGIVAAVLTALVAVANLSVFQSLLPLLSILAGVFAIVEDRRRNLVAGVGLIVLGGVLAVLAIPGGFNTRAGDVGASGGWSTWWALLGGALATVAVVAVRRSAASPVGLASIAVAVVALALSAWRVDSLRSGFADLGNAWPVDVAALLFLAAGYPNLVALRAPSAVAPAPPLQPAAAEPVAAAPKTAARKKAQ